MTFNEAMCPVDCKLQDSTVELPELRQVVLLNARDFGDDDRAQEMGRAHFDKEIVRDLGARGCFAGYDRRCGRGAPR